MCDGIKHFLRVGPALLAVTLVAGCGEEKKDDGPTVSLKGKLVNKGEPWSYDESKIKLPKGVSMPPGLTAGGTSPVQVIFFTDVAGEQAVNAKVNPTTGEFDVPAIKPGRYKIAVFLSTAMPGPGDPFAKKFTVGNTHIVREVAGGEDLVIDISKPQG